MFELGASPWLDWLVSMTLWSGALLAGLFVLDRLLRKQVSAAWRVALYLAVFVRVALPTDWTSPLGVVAGSGSPVEQASAEGGPAATSTTLASPDAPTLIGARHELTATAHTQASASASASASSISTGQIALAVYLLGVFGLLGWIVVARRELGLRVAEASPARSRAAELAPDRRVVEHDVLGPLAFGILDPVIVLPRHLLDELADDELACVMAHELAHLDRRDPALASALSLATALAWPLLPIWLTAARVRQLIELAADERALASCSPRVYGQTLIKLAGRPGLSRPTASMAAGLQLGNFRSLRGRVASLRDRARWPQALQPLAACGLSALVLACSGLSASKDAESLLESCEALEHRAAKLHDQAERSNNDELRHAALGEYDEYADRCQQAPNYGEVVYYGAELLWAQASAAYARGEHDQARAIFAEAHRAFRQALDANPGRFEKDAAIAQLLAKRNELGDAVASGAGRIEPGPADPTFARTEYTPEELELIAASQTYRAHVEDPADAELQTTLYQLGKLAMMHNRFDEAEPLLRELLATPGATELHVWGAEMLTDLLTIRWVDEDATIEQRLDATNELEQWLDDLRATGILEHEQAGALREAAEALRAGIKWKYSIGLLEAGDHLGCAAGFEAIADTWPEHRRLDLLLLNAATCASAAGQHARAQALVDRLERTLPDSELLADARELIE